MQYRQVPLDVFVGRAAQLARVAEVVSLVEAGQPWLVAIEGDPGMGKTALARHVPGRDRRLQGAVRPGLIRPRPILTSGSSTSCCGRLEDAAPLVLPAGGTDLPVSSFAVGAQLLEVVGGQQDTGPVAIVVDDLQWADRSSVEALTFMLRRLSVDPVVAFVIYRGPSGRLGEAAQRMLRSVENRLHLSLGELVLDEVAALAAALTAGPVDDAAVRWLYQGTGGQPLYLRTVLSEGSGFDPMRSGTAGASPVAGRRRR